MRMRCLFVWHWELNLELPHWTTAQVLFSFLGESLTKLLSCLGWSQTCHSPASTSQNSGIFDITRDDQNGDVLHVAW